MELLEASQALTRKCFGKDGALPQAVKEKETVG